MNEQQEVSLHSIHFIKLILNIYETFVISLWDEIDSVEKEFGIIGSLL